MHSLGVISTATGAGKSTEIAALVGEAAARGCRLALISVGQDSHSSEAVEVREGILVVTTQACVEAAASRCDVIESLGIPSPQGELLICGASEPCAIPPVGPTRSDEFARILQATSTVERVTPVVLASWTTTAMAVSIRATRTLPGRPPST